MIRLLYAKFRYLLSVKLSRIQASLMSLVDHKFKQSHFKTVFEKDILNKYAKTSVSTSILNICDIFIQSRFLKCIKIFCVKGDKIKRYDDLISMFNYPRMFNYQM